MPGEDVRKKMDKLPPPNTRGVEKWSFTKREG
jgi:hypothetical protein